MSNPIASQAIWTLNSVSTGKVRLARMKDYDVKSDSKKEAVTEVGNDEAAGIKKKPGAKTISFNFHAQQGTPVPDWKKLETSGEPVALTRQIVGGLRFQYPECYVSSVDDNGDDEGTHMFSVEIIAMKEQAL